MADTILIRTSESAAGLAVVKPAGFLGASFAVYKDRVRDSGARFDWDAKYYTIAIERLPGLIAALEQAGFEIAFSPDLAQRMQREAAAIRADLTAGEQLVAQIDLELAARGQKLFAHQREGIAWLAPRRRALLADSMGLGKLQPIDAKVLTPTGWSAIGNLRVGDEVIGSDGEATTVTGVFPQGVKPSYRVRFSDDSSVEAGPEHLWSVNYLRGGKVWATLVLTTDQLRLRPVLGPDPARRIRRLDLSRTMLRIPMLSAPVEFSTDYAIGTRGLEIDPYTMGALIANGGLSHGTPKLVYGTRDWPAVFAKLQSERADLGVAREYKNTTHVTVRGVVGILRRLALDCKSAYKFIPEEYLSSAVEDRIDLLHGLMDADGSISKTQNRLTYHTISPQLAEDVRELVEGLGGIASVRSYDRSHHDKPTDYSVRMRLPTWVQPFTVPRKLSRYHPGRLARPCRVIESVEYVRDVESVCIQVDAPDALYVTERCILTHNTAQALLATPRGAPVAIVCPASVKLNWVREIEMWRPDLRSRVLAGRKSWTWPLPGEAVIANYEILPRLDEGRGGRIEDTGFGGAGAQTALILDESHFCKNSKATRSRAARAVARAVLDADGRVYLLTGTPLTNRPPELWNVLQVADLAVDAFGSFIKFRELMGATEGQFGLEWSGRVDTSVPARLRQVSLYRRREDVLDLPPKMRVAVPVPGEFPPDVRKLLDAVLGVLDAQGIDLDHATELVDLTRITGAAFEQLAAARAALATAKIPAMIEQIQEYEEAEEPVVVFSAHRAPIDLLGARAGWKTITGDTPSEHRQAIVDDFQAGRLKGLGLTIKAGGIGITLTRACHEIFVDLDFTPAGNNQAEDRCCRIGQTRSVLVKRLVADHEVDRRVEQILRKKQELIDAAIEPSAVVTVNQAAAPLVQHARALEATLAKTVAIQAPTRPQAPASAPERPQTPAPLDVRPAPAPARRMPETPEEQWIASALLQLAGNDPDHARERNDVGFNQVDNGFGHSLADQIADGIGLTAKQYAAAKRLLAKYHRQTGLCPKE